MTAIETRDRALNVKEAAEYLRTEMQMTHITYEIVRRMADQKRLPFFKIGATRVIFAGKLREYIARQQTEAERAVSRAADTKARRPRPKRR